MTFVPGDTAESVSVAINGDGVAELDEEFRVVLSAPSNATLGDASATGTIVDDELMPVLDIDEPSIVEVSRERRRSPSPSRSPTPSRSP